MKKILIICLLAALFLGGCAAPPQSEDTEILTAFYPLYIMTLNITDGVEGVTVSCMASQQTQCLHDYQLSTADMRKMSRCDVLIINGGMEEFLTRAMEALPDLVTVSATDGMDLLADEDEVNVHCWLSPAYHAQMIRNITDGLCALDPAHAAQYRANAADYIAELNALSREIRTALAPVRGAQVICFHEAFAYLAAEAGVEVAATVENEHGALVSAKELKETVALARSADCVLWAASENDTIARTVARESGKKLALIDPCTAGEADRHAYLGAMYRNISIIKEAFSLA